MRMFTDNMNVSGGDPISKRSRPQLLLSTEAIQDLNKALEHFPMALSQQCSEVGSNLT